MQYGPIEFRYAQPFADALVRNNEFLQWVLSKTEFASFAVGARLLHEEMAARRRATTWWRSHYNPTCTCLGCGGKETDILTVFEATDHTRFAIHFEVKHPTDRFNPDGVQSRGYPLRAACWALKTPPTVVPHTLATTALLFAEARRNEYEPHLAHFKTLITFEEIRANFPEATPA